MDKLRICATRRMKDGSQLTKQLLYKSCSVEPGLTYPQSDVARILLSVVEGDKIPRHIVINARTSHSAEGAIDWLLRV